MKALRMVAAGQPLEMQDIPTPSPGPGEVLVQVRAAGICHSDVHYRAGRSPVYPLPLTLGHEIAGSVAALGAGVRDRQVGEQVCLHYLLTCGECPMCVSGAEQFCQSGKMLGHHADGGYAEYLAVPARNALLLPAEIPFEHGATLMCASATAFHALRKARLQPGESLAVFGAGGLGISAVQLGHIFGAREVYAVDINAGKLALAARYGAVPVLVDEADPVEQVREATHGRGVDAALELVGLPVTQLQALRCLAPLGRAVMVGIGDQPVPVDAYRQLIGPEAELIGSNDHLLVELPVVIEYARQGRLDLSAVVSRTIPLEAGAVNQALDELQAFGGGVRTVILPGTTS
jgi:D-arabinose 1-dehydrogenase-like Zn-dependent alcohol dehydrogenase